MSRVSAKRIRRADALILTSLLWFMALFLRYVLPPLFGTFQIQYDVSRAELGLAYSALMIAYSTMQFPAGWLADRLGMVKVIVGGAAVFGTAALLISLSLSWYGLVAGLVLVGVGTGGHKTVSLPLLSNRYPSSPGRTLGLMDMVGQFGGVAGPAAVVAIGMLGADWRILFLLSAGVIFLLAGVFFGQHYWGLWENRTTVSSGATETTASDGDNPGKEARDNDNRDDSDDSYVMLFVEPRFTVFIAATVLIAFCWNGATAFMPLYLTDSAGLSPNLANGLYGLLFAASLAQPVLGALSDRVGQLRVMAVTIAASGLAIGGLLVVVNPVVVGLCVLGLGTGMHGYRPVRDAYLTKLIPDAVAGGTFGVVRTIMIVSGSIAPFVVGLLIDFASYTVAFAVLTASVFAAVALFLGLLVAS
ncbi:MULTISPECIES: MFS transporter [Salinibaculum]|uniref:MFS transporter n=1 Tax=Salinibaculum TaxID=2732368 RepID=UPI0030D08568